MTTVVSDFLSLINHKRALTYTLYKRSKVIIETGADSDINKSIKKFEIVKRFMRKNTLLTCSITPAETRGNYDLFQ